MKNRPVPVRIRQNRKANNFYIFDRGAIILMDYMPIILVVIAASFLIPFFISGIRTRNKDKQRFVDKNIDVLKMTKKFAVNKGRKVVGFYVDRFGEPYKEAAIMEAMTPGTIISDASGNQYIIEEFQKWCLYGTYGHIFGESTRSRYLIFAVHEIGTKTTDISLEAFNLEAFNRESAKRKAAVKAGQLSEEEYLAWFEQQKTISDTPPNTN